jgi:hypothetical protein
VTEREQEIVHLHVVHGDIQVVADILNITAKRVRNVVAMYRHETKDVGYHDEGLEDNPIPQSYDSSRILLIPDLHIPYHHKKTFEFIDYLLDKYNPTMVVCTGDEVDSHSLSFHSSDPDLQNSGGELEAAQGYIHKLYEYIPKMHLLHSNHGSMVYRKAKEHGISRHYFKPYTEVLGTPDWQWHMDLTIELPNKQQVYCHHGKSANVLRLSQTMGMCAVQGHYHEQAGISYWSNPNQLMWGMQLGCLIDRKSLAFAYNNVNLKRPVLSAGVIIDSVPHIEPMSL